MRELEVLMGLDNEQRMGGMDPLAHMQRLAQEGKVPAAALAELEATSQAPSLNDVLTTWLSRTPIHGSSPGDEGDEIVVRTYIDNHLNAMKAHGEEVIAHMVAIGHGEEAALRPRIEAGVSSATAFLLHDGIPLRHRAGLLFIESYRELPLLSWPRRLIDSFVDLEQSMLLFRAHHARMVERMIGRRMGTGGSSGVDYLDATTKYRIFVDLWAVRTLLVKRGDALPNGPCRFLRLHFGRINSLVRIDVDGNQVILVFVEGDFERVEDEADVGFLKTVEGDEFFFELLTKHVLGGVKWSAHSDLEGTGTNDSGAFKAGVLACWLDHLQSRARDSHSADIATLFEPTSLFFGVERRRCLLCSKDSNVADNGGEKGQHQQHPHQQRKDPFTVLPFHSCGLPPSLGSREPVGASDATVSVRTPSRSSRTTTEVLSIIRSLLRSNSPTSSVGGIALVGHRRVDFSRCLVRGGCRPTKRSGFH